MNRSRAIALLFSGLIFGSTLFAQDAILMRASFQINNGDYNSAYEVLSELDSPASEDVACYYEMLAISASGTGQAEVAIESWKRRMDLEHPGIAFIELAKLYFEITDYTSGYQFLTMHLESSEKLPYSKIISDPAFANLDRDRVWIRFWSKDWYSQRDDEMAEVASMLSADFVIEEPIKDLITRNEDDVSVLLLAAQYYQKLQMKNRWSQIIERLIESNAQQINVLKNAADLYNNDRDYSRAVALYLESLKSNPYQPEIWMTVIEVYEKMGDNQSALEIMEDLNRYGVENSKLWLSLARNRMNDNPDSAMPLVNQVLLSNPLDETAFNLRSELYLKAGNIEKALFDLSQSLDIKPDQPDVYFSRAKIRFESGNTTGACHDWNKALRYGHRKALNELHKHCGY